MDTPDPPSSRYPVPAGECRVEEVISRSRFIATLAPAPSVEAARACVARVSAEFSDATHNCSAFLVGPPGATAQVGMSDDGEPHGTAGRPMLNALVHGGLGDVAVVVTRYFGGVKLGRGGLVRAYGGAVQSVLETVERIERITWKCLRLTLDYPLLKTLKRLYPRFEAELVDEEFGAQVVHALRVPEEREEALCAALRDASSGGARIERDGTGA